MPCLAVPSPKPVTTLSHCGRNSPAYCNTPSSNSATTWRKTRCDPSLGRKNWIHVGSPEAGPKIAAILSVVESCRRLKLPVCDYLAAILPGLADVPIQCLPELTPPLGPHSGRNLQQNAAIDPCSEIC